VTFGKAGIRGFDRATRAHALLLSGVCGVILLLGFPLPQARWLSLGWSSNEANRDEAAIDSALNQAATAALAGREGTIIIMDAQTGRVRALVNPKTAYAQAQMPGSAFKPFTALAALRAGVIEEDSRSVCPGRFMGLSFSLPCVHADHLPPFSPAQAIAYSCNYYFATLGQRLGRERLVETARQFGFGQPTGLSASDEVAGLLRPCESGVNSRIRAVESNHASTQPDCEAREGVGESEQIQVTPIQLLTAYAALVNGGHLYQPGAGNAESFRAIERAQINISSQHREVITEGMAGAIRYGTARQAKLDSLPLTILGKTGTALPAKGFRANGWFIGFAGPFQSSRELDSSQVDLAVLVLLTRAHGSEAAALARPIFDAYANLISRNNEAPSKKDSSNNVPASPGPSVSASHISVHLVHDNVTEELPLEDYVLGVMRAEGTMETEPESLKALAIAIRTYALKNAGRHAKDGYDFCSTTHCQRFVIGRPAADARLIDAARATEGQILLDERGQVADAYFGASCGGETANIGDLWGVTPPDYLNGVRDEYCLSGPHAHWNDVISRANLLRALQSDARTDVGNHLDQVLISRRDETGRAEFITLEGERRKTVRGWDFKIIVGRMLGWNVLKSSRFDVARAGTNFVFRGSGFGHGLGLCQEGAHVMAARGVSYQKILEKYFPGTKVKKDTETGRRGDAVSANPANRWQADILLNARVSRSRIVPASPRPPVSAAPRPRNLTISSEHFRVTYPADVERREADQVLNTLESARSDFMRRASSASLSNGIPLLEIRLNESTGDFTSRTGQPWWAAAATKGNRIELQPFALLKRRGVLTMTLRHELAHVFIDLISRDRAPRWLEEGFAIYLAGEGQMFSHYIRRGAMTTEELEKRLQRPGSQTEMRALYAQAYLNVSQMVRYESEASVWKKLAGS
jgi:stage II sporulation protein D (peptidoglycan lytic transglycosylase)